MREISHSLSSHLIPEMMMVMVMMMVVVVVVMVMMDQGGQAVFS